MLYSFTVTILFIHLVEGIMPIQICYVQRDQWQLADYKSCIITLMPIENVWFTIVSFRKDSCGVYINLAVSQSREIDSSPE